MSFWLNLPRPIIGLSPMDGVTDACFRSVVARQSRPDVIFTEFTHVHDVCRGPEIHLETLLYSEIERPVIAQLYGKDPDLFYMAAHAVCELGFDGLDINMGCPSKSVASSGSGAGLIRTPELARAIIQAAKHGIDDWARGQTLEQAGFKSARVDAFERLNRQRNSGASVQRRRLPLSVKTRLGYDSVTVETWLEQLLMEQPVVISLHGRTLTQMYRGAADWSAIARAAALAKATRTLLLGNGDVQSPEDAVSRVRETGVDGVLVGRAVLGAPWFFRSKEQVRQRICESNGAPGASEPGPAVSQEERFAILVDHAHQFQALYGRQQFYRMRKHLGWYCKGFAYAAALRARMVRVSSAEELDEVLVDFQDRAQAGIGAPQAESLDELSLPASRCS
ncbi:MAG: tRNA-dihydrouridine synthase [Nitrospira sp. BO4]|jgi:tRNA-dihydrouridine synthase|nr:tRNA-dihydrouridine synthase [Nitrospira sp. BO4]